jgi:hypothetical protein
MMQSMRHIAVLAAALLAWGAVPPAFAQIAPTAAPRAPAPKLAPDKPYKPVAVTVAPALEDASFTAFRAQLAAVAKDRVYGELARLVVAQGFFWEGDVGGFDPKRPAVENLAAAISLEGAAGSGWNTLAAFAAVAEAGPLPSRPGIVCAPAHPQYDPVEFDQLIALSGTRPEAWRYPRAGPVPLRVVPRPTGRVVETLGTHLVRLVPYDGPPEYDPARTGWPLVAAPGGNKGFVVPDVLMPLRSDRLCYHKDVTGRWRIAGYISSIK